MSKLQYKTKPPKNGFVFNESNMQHVSTGFGDKFPTHDTQSKAHRLVGDVLRKLIQDLADIGYDPTRAGFFIHFKEETNE